MSAVPVPPIAEAGYVACPMVGDPLGELAMVALLAGRFEEVIAADQRDTARRRVSRSSRRPPEAQESIRN